MTEVIEEARLRTPFVRWERSLHGGAELVAAMQDELLDIGVEPLDLKPAETATVSIATAQHFKNFAPFDGGALTRAILASQFLEDTSRSPLRTTPAEPTSVGFLNGRSGRGVRVALFFECPTIDRECASVRKLLQIKPRRPFEAHLSIGNIKRPTDEKVEQEILSRLFSLVSGSLIFMPVAEKGVAADASTTMRSLRSLEREYRINQIKKRMLASGIGRRFSTIFREQPAALADLAA